MARRFITGIAVVTAAAVFWTGHPDAQTSGPVVSSLSGTVADGGTVQLSEDANDIADPQGSRNGRRATNAPLPNAPAGALIARIGFGAPVLIGSGAAEVRAPRALRASTRGRARRDGVLWERRLRDDWRRRQGDR